MLMRRISFEGYHLTEAECVLRRRLLQAAADVDCTFEGNEATLTLRDERALEALITALALIICRDLMHFELAREIDKLPLPLTKKQALLTEAVRLARTSERLALTRRSLREYLLTEEFLHLAGFLRFRMPEIQACWRRMVERAAEELQLREEYLSLMGVLRAFVEQQPPLAGEVSLCLNPDGSCTLTDDSDSRVEYAPCPPEQLISMLVGLSPARLTVYDLSGGGREAFTEALSRVFAGRVHFYHV